MCSIPLCSIPQFDPENENNNIEYKRHLIFRQDKKYNKKITQLCAQMTRRISNGIRKYNKPEAIYYIGVNDNGVIANESEKTIMDSVMIIQQVCNMIDAIVYNREFMFNNTVVKITIQKNRDDTNDTRILFIGDSDENKAKIINILVNRSNIVQDYKPLRKINYELIAYNNADRIYYDDEFNNSMHDIIGKSTKIISLINVPGRQKYTSLGLYALFAHKPDHVCIVLNAFDDIPHFYTILCDFMEIPYTLVSVNKLSTHMHLNIYDECDYLNDFNNYILNITKKKSQYIDDTNNNNSNNSNIIEYIINGVIHNKNYGIIVNGIMNYGNIKSGDRLLIGPSKNTFSEIIVNTIHKNRSPCNILNSSSDGSMLITVLDPSFKITKHMIITNKNSISSFTNIFYLRLCNTETNLIKGTKLLLYTSNIKTFIYIKKIVSINDPALGTLIFTYSCYSPKNKIIINDTSSKVCIKYGLNYILGTIFLTL